MRTICANRNLLRRDSIVSGIGIFDVVKKFVGIVVRRQLVSSRHVILKIMFLRVVYDVVDITDFCLC